MCTIHYISVLNSPLFLIAICHVLRYYKYLFYRVCLMQKVSILYNTLSTIALLFYIMKHNAQIMFNNVTLAWTILMIMCDSYRPGLLIWHNLENIEDIILLVVAQWCEISNIYKMKWHNIDKYCYLTLCRSHDLSLYY